MLRPNGALVDTVDCTKFKLASDDNYDIQSDLCVPLGGAFADCFHFSLSLLYLSLIRKSGLYYYRSLTARSELSIAVRNRKHCVSLHPEVGIYIRFYWIFNWKCNLCNFSFTTSLKACAKLKWTTKIRMKNCVEFRPIETNFSTTKRTKKYDLLVI